MIRTRFRSTRPLALLLAISLTACASKPDPHMGSLEQITSTGVMRIGTTGEQPPLSMTMKSGELFGLDVALARVLAKSMGVEAQFVQLPFDRLLDALEAGEVDMVMSGLTITPERVQRVGLVGPYYTSGKTILTRSSELASIDTAGNLDAEGRRFAALSGSTSEAFARESLSKAKLVVVEHLQDAVRKVVDGEVDALVADRETCHFAVLRHPDAGLIASEVAFTVEPMGVAVPRDQPHFQNLVRSYLEALEKSGTLQKARSYWFKNPAWVADLR